MLTAEKMGEVTWAAEQFIKRGHMDLAMTLLLHVAGLNYAARVEWLVKNYEWPLDWAEKFAVVR